MIEALKAFFLTFLIPIMILFFYDHRLVSECHTRHTSDYKCFLLALYAIQKTLKAKKMYDIFAVPNVIQASYVDN